MLNYKKVLEKVFFACYFWDSARLCKLPIPLKVGIKNAIYDWNWLRDSKGFEVKIIFLKQSAPYIVFKLA